MSALFSFTILIVFTDYIETEIFDFTFTKVWLFVIFRFIGIFLFFPGHHLTLRNVIEESAFLLLGRAYAQRLTRRGSDNLDLTLLHILYGGSLLYCCLWDLDGSISASFLHILIWLLKPLQRLFFHNIFYILHRRLALDDALPIKCLLVIGHKSTNLVCFLHLCLVRPPDFRFHHILNIYII